MPKGKDKKKKNQEDDLPPDDLPPDGELPDDAPIGRGRNVSILRPDEASIESFCGVTGADRAVAERYISHFPPAPGADPDVAVESFFEGALEGQEEEEEQNEMPPPPDELPPDELPPEAPAEAHADGDQEVMLKQQLVDTHREEVAAMRALREKARGTDEEPALAAQLQELEAALAAACGELSELQHGATPLQAPDAKTKLSLASRMAAILGGLRGGLGPILGKKKTEAPTKAMEATALRHSQKGQRLKKKFDSFDREGKGYLSRADIIGCIEHLGFDCDEDYCTQVLQTFSEGKDVMDLAGFTRMWEHMAPHEMEPDAVGGVGGGESHPTDEAWREERLAQLKQEEEERIRAEATTLARTAVQEQDDLASLLRDFDILRALFGRIDGGTGRTSKAQWLVFLNQDEGIRKVLKLDNVDRQDRERLFARWPVSGITFAGFVALLRTQFGRVLGIEYKYADEVAEVQAEEARLRELLKDKEGERLRQEQAEKDATAARIREEVMATARQTQAQQLAEMKQEVLGKLAAETDAESQSLLEAELAEVDAAIMGLDALAEWPKRISELEKARQERGERLRATPARGQSKALASDEAHLAAAGWLTAQDESGQVYYYHAATMQTRWDPPVVDRPLPPPPPPPRGEGGAAPDEAPVSLRLEAAATQRAVPGAPPPPAAPPAPVPPAANGGSPATPAPDPNAMLAEIRARGGKADANAAPDAAPSVDLLQQIEAEASVPEAVPAGEEPAEPAVDAAVGGRISIAERSRRLREARQAAASGAPVSVLGTLSSAVGAAAPTPAPQPEPEPEQEASVAPVADPPEAVPQTTPAVAARPNGLLAARRARREQAAAEREGAERVSSAARVRASNARRAVSPSSSRRSVSPGSSAAEPLDVRPSWARSPVRVGRKGRAPAATPAPESLASMVQARRATSPSSSRRSVSPTSSVSVVSVSRPPSRSLVQAVPTRSPPASVATTVVRPSILGSSSPRLGDAPSVAVAEAPPPWAASSSRRSSGLGSLSAASREADAAPPPWARGANPPKGLASPQARRNSAASAASRGSSISYARSAAASGAAGGGDAPWRRR